MKNSWMLACNRIRFLLISGAVLLLFLVYAPLKGQSTRYIDSLEVQLSKKNPDTVRVSLLTSLANSYAFINFSKGLNYAREAVSLANKINHNRLKLSANRRLALMYGLGGDYSSALSFETTALQIAATLNDSTELGLGQSNIGNYYHEMGVYDQAYYNLTNAYNLLKSGRVSHYDSILMNIALHNVGRVFKELGQYETALQYLQLSQKRSAELGDREGNPYALDEIGDVMLRMGKYDSALLYLQRSLAETRQLLKENPASIVIELQTKTLNKIARVYMFTGERDNALAYYDSTYRLHKVTNNQYGIAEVELGRGRLYLNENDFNTAEKYINTALPITKVINAHTLEIRCYQQLATLWEKKGDYKKSLEFFKLHKTFNDSIFSVELQQKLLRGQVQFATELKDDQIEALTRLEEFRLSEIKKQELIRNVLVVIMALAVILLFTVYRSGQRRKRINNLLLQHQQEMKKRSAELEQLNQVKDKFFSIISHDLRSPINALAGILDLIDKGAIDDKELPAALKELRIRFNHTRTLLNNLLDWTLVQMDKMKLRPMRVNLAKLVDENIELMSSMQSKKINFSNLVAPDVFVHADNNTINLVFRNLIGNAMKFTNDGGTIRISAQEKEKEWEIAVADNGIGMIPETQNMLFDKVNPYSTRGTANEKGIGLGLILCKEFVEKNNGRIWVKSKEGEGSTFWFTLLKAPKITTPTNN